MDISRLCDRVNGGDTTELTVELEVDFDDLATLPSEEHHAVICACTISGSVLMGTTHGRLQSYPLYADDLGWLIEKDTYS